MLEPIVVTPSSATSSTSSTSLPPSPLLFPTKHLSISAGAGAEIEREGEGVGGGGGRDGKRESNNISPTSILTIDPPSRKISSISSSRKTSSPSRVFSSVSKFMTLDFPSSATRRLSQLLPPRSSAATASSSSASANNNNGNGGKRSMSSRLSAGQMSLRRFSGAKKDTIQPGGSTMSSGRSLLAATLRAKFGHDSQDDSASNPLLINDLDKYTSDELKEYRQVFNMFDADRSGAIGLDELENAITNLGVDSKTVDLESIIKEADKRGNHQIDFDEFCEVMQKMNEKNRNWNEIIKECFAVFDRSESGLITRKDFEFILREMGGIQNPYLIDELFTEFDVDSDGFIDYDEFGFLVKNYLTDDDIS